MTNTAKEIDTIEQQKLNALAEFLGVSPEDIMLDGGNFTHGGGEYDVYTDSEADERAADYIKESLWAFNYSFLAKHSEVISKIPEESFNALQGRLCEDFNDAITAMLDSSFDQFVEDAVGIAGRGHFLSGYDGIEIEQNNFYIYRTN